MNNQRVLLHFVYILLISERDFVIHVYMWTLEYLCLLEGYKMRCTRKEICRSEGSRAQKGGEAEQSTGRSQFKRFIS